MREDGEPALPDSPTTPEQKLENAEIAPDVTTPQVVQQTSESNNEKVDSGSLESTTSLPIVEQTIESRGDVVSEPAAVELEQKDDIARSPEAKVDTTNSSQSTNEGADSPTTTNKDAAGLESTTAGDDSSASNRDQTESGSKDVSSEQIAESAVSGSEDATNSTQEVAGNVSTEEIREDMRTDQNEREPQVLNDVRAVRQSQETSEESHDEL